MITKLPLVRLITSSGAARNVGDVGADAIRELLRGGTVRFVIADVGHELVWIPEAECFDAWKREVQPHLAEPGQRVDLKQFPDEYAYFASQWDDRSTPVVLLAKTH